MNISLYILIILFVLYFIYSQNGRRDNTSKFALYGCILLGLETGLRHLAVGPDTPNYYYKYQETCNMSWSDILSSFTVSAEEFRDPSYNLIVKAFSSICPSWQLFLCAVAVFYFFGFWRVLVKYVKTLEGILLALVLYLALFNIISLSGIRQCITTGIAFLLIPLINERKWKIVIPIILVGATIHISLLFLLLLIPLLLLPDNIKKIIYLISLFLIPIIAVGSREIVMYMSSFLANDYYAGYADADNEATPIIYVALCSLVSIFEYCHYRKLTEDPNTSFLAPSNILMTLTVPLIFLDGTMIRIGQYFTLYMTVSLPLIFDKTHMRKPLYIISIAFLSYQIISSSSKYYFFWETVRGFYY